MTGCVQTLSCNFPCHILHLITAFNSFPKHLISIIYHLQITIVSFSIRRVAGGILAGVAINHLIFRLNATSSKKKENISI